MQWFYLILAPIVGLVPVTAPSAGPDGLTLACDFTITPTRSI